MYKPIHNFFRFSNLVLPLTYSNALSYLEDIDAMVAKLNEVIDSYNELINYYNSLDDIIGDVNNKISEMDSAIAEMEEEIQETKQELINQINALDASLTGKVDKLIIESENTIKTLENQLTNEINTQLALINEQITILKADFAKQDASIDARVDKKLNDFLNEIPDVQNVLVINPVTGKIDTIQNVINYLYEYLRCEALTAWEYDCLGMTAQEYDNFFIIGFGFGLTANEYDWYGKTILSKYRKHNYYDAISGKLVSINNKVDDNTDLLKASGSYTAQEYDELELTAEQYDSLNISAYTYDWHFNQIQI